jgi:hypothetical protein
MSLCTQCSAEVDAQGQARAALRDSCPIIVPTSLLGALSQIPHCAPLDPPVEDVASQFAADVPRVRRKRR